MKWVADKLSEGEEVTFRPRGHSMSPLIESGQEVTVVPCDSVTFLKPGTIVLAKVKGRIYLHKITGVKKQSSGWKYQISNNRGHTNGWASMIYGVLKEHWEKLNE